MYKHINLLFTIQVQQLHEIYTVYIQHNQKQ